MLGVDKKLNVDQDNEPEITLEIEFDEVDFDDDNPNVDLTADYKFIRSKLRYSVAACEAVLKSALKDMASNPGARAVEGCSAIIKTITECTNQLLDLHSKRKKIFNIKTEPDVPDGELGDGEKPKGLKARVDEILDSFEDDAEE